MVYRYKGLKINGKRIDEHRWIMQNHLKRKLNRFEIVHHKNGNKQDNRIENLEIKSLSEHTSDFMKEYMNRPQVKKRCSKLGKINGFQPHRYKKGRYWCNSCKKYLFKNNFYPDTKTKKNKCKIRTYCKQCDNLNSKLYRLRKIRRITQQVKRTGLDPVD
jgi:hypothetical protein